MDGNIHPGASPDLRLLPIEVSVASEEAPGGRNWLFHKAPLNVPHLASLLMKNIHKLVSAGILIPECRV
jgi:hypothetical protein